MKTKEEAFLIYYLRQRADLAEILSKNSGISEKEGGVSV
ncbi:hypothetical protein SDC9_88293 [bioreactor metagenome]|uniref:Uncharacterized protein n=1 Tax=bioreactor metagenome TaxID=1076179 RepID=A0A644ZLP5_9ZZZZ